MTSHALIDSAAPTCRPAVGPAVPAAHNAAAHNAAPAAGTASAGSGRPAAVSAPPDADLRPLAATAVRRILEVLDRRRRVEQVASMCAPHVLDQLRVITRGRAGAGSAAVVSRVHLQRSDSGAIEVFATYRRGERTHALAARLEHSEVRERVTPGGPRRKVRRWTVVALAVG